MVEKRCPLCDTVKPLDAFARNGRRQDGRGTYCRPCAREKYQAPARERKRLVVPTTEGEQQCRTCGEVKAVTDFYWQSDKGKRDTECVNPCRRERDRRSWVDGRRARQRTKQLREKYDLTDDEYAALLVEQGGACAICGALPSDDLALAVDHNHATGVRRSLLCSRCNCGLGLFLDQPRLLRLAALYLEQHSGVGT